MTIPTPNVPESPRTVLVTGGGRGIGRVIADRFEALGDKVAVLDLEPPEPHGHMLSVGADVSDPDSVNAAFDQVEAVLGPVEVLIANAGIIRDGLMIRMSDKDFGAVMRVNLGGAFYCARRAARGMLKLKRGRIVFTGSVVGLYGGNGQVNYSSSKAGLVGLARSITRELGSRHITANVVAPGFSQTKMPETLKPETQAQYLEALPAHYFGTVEDVAAAVEFLASPGAAYIS
ncbi:MAG: SDR family NAD(P)-dependent oxidoreductase, partial [Bifidobacteriaceae bacterium]|nr:SDR family NAD(P)-dependent oxidoreductase [Bifidobacteriaceae bacterium]